VRGPTRGVAGNEQYVGVRWRLRSGIVLARGAGWLETLAWCGEVVVVEG
jgi:hypothetical protein